MPDNSQHLRAPKADTIPEFIYAQKLLGQYVQQWRKKSGLSLRELEARSGVSNSEISKIESGSQSCRLESFIRLCAAMGVPCGYILDQIIVFDFRAYESKVKNHPLFQTMFKDYAQLQDILAVNIAIFVTVAAQLVICTRPSVRAAHLEYPHPDIQSAFIRFASAIDKTYQPSERAAILTSLTARPLEVLIERGLLNLDLIFKLVTSLRSHDSTNPSRRARAFEVLKFPSDSMFWYPFVPQLDVVEENSPLTTVHDSVKSSEVKPLWPLLKKRLQKATTETGAKSKLADFLGVKIASVSQWLTDKKSSAREPGAETALRMLNWVEQQERK